MKRNVPDVDGKRECSRCGEIKYLEHFTRNRKCYAGYERKCKDCTNRSRHTPEQTNNRKSLRRKHYDLNREKYLAYEKKRYLANPEKFREYGRKHAKENPHIYRTANYRRSAREQDCNDLTKEQAKLLIDNYKFCIYCDCKDNLTVDHIIPLAKGGRNTLSNLVVACWDCNNAKRTKDAIEFYRG
jgi:5-methylcytosine-specific restriction endonuclease McrA